MALLDRLGCSLVISNYQSGTVVTFSSLGDGRPVQMFASFAAAMGLALSGDRLAVATVSEVIVLANIRKLAPSQPKFPGVFDGYFVPRVRYAVGKWSLHDMAFDEAGLLAVNTAYPCICRIDGFHNFVPIWQPPWISELRPGDRCHLNGMAMENGTVRYATSLGTTDTPRGWTENKLDDGVLVEVPSGRILASGLCMPHSPHLIGDRLYLIEAGTGTLVEIDRTSGARRPIVALPGFARGLAAHGGYLFAGLSLMRDSRPFEELPVEQSGQELICGVVAIELATGQVVGTLRYTGGCSEIHDLQVVAGVHHLGISGCDSDAQAEAVDMPDTGLRIAPEQAWIDCGDAPEDLDHGPAGSGKDDACPGIGAEAACGPFQCRRSPAPHQQGSRLLRGRPHRAGHAHGLAVRPSGQGRQPGDRRLHLSDGADPIGLHEERAGLRRLGRPDRGGRLRGHQSPVHAAGKFRCPGGGRKAGRILGRIDREALSSDRGRSVRRRRVAPRLRRCGAVRCKRLSAE